MWKLVNFAEIDQSAVKAYCAVHNVAMQKNLGDVSQIDTKQLPDFTMLCGGSPCQDFSLAGKQNGVIWTCNDCHYQYNPLEAHYTVRTACPHCHSKDITKTRSALLIEYLRVLHDKHPRFAFFENVKNITSVRFSKTFNLFLKEIDEYGYNAYWKVLNAKDYGIPQNRERVYIFIVDKTYDNGQFCFPEPFDNGLCLNDLIDSADTVDKKYYISEAMLEKLKLVNTPNAVIETGSVQHLRRLTPKECWRLMGFTDDLYDKAKQAGIPDTQLYKQAGNSIVTDVLYYIYLAVYKAMPYLFEDLTVLSLFSGIGAFETALDRFYANTSDTSISNCRNNTKGKDTTEIFIIDATYIKRAPRIYTAYAPTLRAGRAGYIVCQCKCTCD